MDQAARIADRSTGDDEFGEGEGSTKDCRGFAKMDENMRGDKSRASAKGREAHLIPVDHERKEKENADLTMRSLARRQMFISRYVRLLFLGLRLP